MDVALELLAAIETVSDLARLEALHWAGLRRLSFSDGDPGSSAAPLGRRAVAAGERAWTRIRFDRCHAYEVDIVERLGIWPR